MMANLNLEPVVEQIKERLNLESIPDDYLEFMVNTGYYQNLDTDFVIYGINLTDPENLDDYPSVVYSTESYFDYYELQSHEIVICDEIELEDSTDISVDMDDDDEDEEDNEPDSETVDDSVTTIVILNAEDGKIYYSDETDPTYREVAFESFSEFMNTIKEQESNLMTSMYSAV
jgi:hypothetical protein